MTGRRRASVADENGSLVLACDFAARQPGNFLPTQLAVARAVHDRLGLETVFVLPERARRRHWVAHVRDAGWTCEFLPASARARPRALLRIARGARARVVHSHYTWFDLDALYAGRAAGAPVIWHVRSALFGRPYRQRASDVLKARILARGCAAVIGVSDHVGREIRDRGFPPDKVRVIENALVLERFAAAGETRAEFRRRLGLDAGERVVVSFGWPPDRKGVDVLLDGVARARAEDPAIRLLLVGEREQLETFAAQRLGRLPEWLTVIAPVEDVGSLMGASDAFVSAARTEGFGFAIGEAMACGLPVVGSDTPGTAHFARSPSFLEYPCEDAAALAARLRAALGPDAKAAIGEPGRRWALANLGMDRYLDEVLECYRSVLA